MRLIKSQCKSALISEKDYTKILARFDRTKAIASPGGVLSIHQKCPLCQRFLSFSPPSSFPDCSRCPLTVFASSRSSGCEVLIHHILAEVRAFNLATNFVRWIPNNMVAEMHIDKVHEALLNLPKVSRKEV